MKSFAFGLLLALVALTPPAIAGYETGAANQVMRVPNAGGRPQFGSVDLSKSAAVGTSVLPSSNGGSGTVLGSTMPRNVGLAATVSSNALTIALKQADGATDCASAAPCIVPFRSSTAATGSYSDVSVTSSNAVTVPSSTTLGTTSGATHLIYVYAINNAGTVELGVVVGQQLDEGKLQSSTAVSGGSSQGVLYSGTARTSKSVKLLGRLTISETTAGTWASNPTEVAIASFSSPVVRVLTPVKTTTYAAAVTDDVVQGDTSSGAFTVTLPSAASAGVGKVIGVTKVNSGTNLLTISGNIAGSSISTVLHRKSETDLFISDGTTWQWLSDPFRTESANVTIGSACVINSQSGNWISVGTCSTGISTLSFPSGVFSATPICPAVVNGTVGSYLVTYNSTSSTANVLQGFASVSGGATNVNVFVECHGPR